MQLNWLEKQMMNNPLRSAVQRHLEVPELLRMGGRMHGGRALEVGCGRGVGVELILEHFGADCVDAFDVDPAMVELATQRLARFGDAVRVFVGDASAIEAPGGHYAAVFDFGILHHVPRWRDAIREIRRVLEPGGRFYAEEIFARFTGNAVVRRLLDHPEAGRFDHDAFRTALEAEGFRVEASRDVLGLGGFFVATRGSA
jgi:ubiquinone/menaquinone biosynthesis C-methylase UbiE